MFFVGWAISRSHREQGGSIFLVLLVVKPAIFYLIAVVRYFKLVFSGKNIKNCCNKKGRLSILVFPWELPTYLHLPKDCPDCPPPVATELIRFKAIIQKTEILGHLSKFFRLFEEHSPSGHRQTTFEAGSVSIWQTLQLSLLSSNSTFFLFAQPTFSFICLA